jgi:predicted type IV restriction endonuclease
MKTESRLQQDCYLWFHNTFPQYRGLFFEINNNSENAREGMRHRCLGRVKGVADTCLLAPGGVTVFIEFKTETGVQSSAQKEWEIMATSTGHRYCIVRSEEEFKNLIYTYL